MRSAASSRSARRSSASPAIAARFAASRSTSARACFTAREKYLLVSNATKAAIASPFACTNTQLDSADMAVTNAS